MVSSDPSRHARTLTGVGTGTCCCSRWATRTARRTTWSLCISTMASNSHQRRAGTSAPSSPSPSRTRRTRPCTSRAVRSAPPSGWADADLGFLAVAEAHHRFTNEEQDWGFTRFVELRKLFSVSEGRPKSIIDDDETVITAFVRVLKDPTGVLWHNFHKCGEPASSRMIADGCQLRFEERDRTRRAQEPGRDLLHELPPSVPLPHQQLPQGALQFTLARSI